MSLPLSLLICLSVFQLCLGAPPEKRHIKEQGWTEKRPESKDVQKAAQYAVEMFNKKAKNKVFFKLISITSAKSKVTNRINFKIDAVLGGTKCPMMENLDLKSCILDEEQLQCQFVVTLDPGNEEHELKTKKCHKVATKA
ncbi:cystatin-like isoform X1 [Xiphophorus couchianus]|uniref:cystatin-like isoform X1 n=1 Tax=Xiphophorus couchianus TaxID=32473 RepID=UPI0010162299|nr:cystatin-like isoform X1 [Xiphophorus couchianus]